jgi:hypothetical protein
MRTYLAALWLLSGAPVGVAMIFLPPSALLWCFTLFVLLETGHNMAPITLAWTHGEFRQWMVYQRPLTFIWLPIAILVVMLTIGIVTQLGWTTWDYQLYGLTDWTNLLPAAMWVYWPWKIYHFGMQNFGVMQLLGIGRRGLNMALGLGITAFGMAIVPAIADSRWIAFLMLGTFSVNHWVVDLGLSARVMQRGWLFLLAMLAIGAVGFVWMVPTSDGMMIRLIPVVIALRLWAGITHFYPYSRWVWKLSDPQVRATIGAALVSMRVSHVN